MVGPPKTISDLKRVEGNPRAVCRSCKFTREWDREQLIRERMFAHLSNDWRAFCAQARCEQCGSADVRMEVIPFAKPIPPPSRPIKEALVFKALCVLDEAMEQARGGKVLPSLGLRFALAYLYAIGDRRKEWFDREPYDEFWMLATKRGACDGGTDSVGRFTAMQANINGIARAAGLEMTVTVLHAVGRATGRLP